MLFGYVLTSRQTTSCATIEYLLGFQTITMWMESGQSNDCVHLNVFSYNHLNVLLLMPDTGLPLLTPGPFG